jgi:tetratricopeptide (TPR) repeat protein
MTATINGIGTHYYGRKNRRFDVGVCDSCNRTVQLESYETGLYFVVLYIPVIPLGRKQILDYCPSCSRHRVLPAGQWKQIKQKAIDSSTEQLAQKMGDPVAAIEHLQSLTAFHELEEARELAPAIETQHPGNAKLQFFLGAWYEKHGGPADANRCFERAYQLEPTNPAMIRAKGIGLIDEGKPDAARTLFSALEPPSTNFDPGIFYLLAKSFQTANRHKEALEVFRLINDTPLAKTNPEYRKTVQLSEKASGIVESMLPKKKWFQIK